VLKDMSIAEFGRILASNSPAPGGGSVAALSGMLGANLVSMVCRLTIGKQGYEAHFDEASKILVQSEALSESLLSRIDLDTAAFIGVMAAFKLPKDSAEQKAARTEAIQQGYKSAIQSPLGIAQECQQVLGLAERLLGKSNSNALSDLGVAGQQAFAGLEGALMNVKINLPSIKDEGFVSATAVEIAALLGNSQKISQHIYAEVSRGLGG
jgi:methenyltetrahydrofolate cyclohydrolase